jgi:hypothetical protein
MNGGRGWAAGRDLVLQLLDQAPLTAAPVCPPLSTHRKRPLSMGAARGYSGGRLVDEVACDLINGRVAIADLAWSLRAPGAVDELCVR